jgi:hypothetical protein
MTSPETFCAPDTLRRVVRVVSATAIAHEVEDDGPAAPPVSASARITALLWAAAVVARSTPR